MHSTQTAPRSQSRSLPRQWIRFLLDQARSDAAVMIGLPLLVTVGAILGVINLLALIHVFAVLLGG